MKEIEKGGRISRDKGSGGGGGVNPLTVYLTIRNPLMH